MRRATAAWPAQRPAGRLKGGRPSPGQILGRSQCPNPPAATPGRPLPLTLSTPSSCLGLMSFLVHHQHLELAQTHVL